MLPLSVDGTHTTCTACMQCMLYGCRPHSKAPFLGECFDMDNSQRSTFSGVNSAAGFFLRVS